MRCLINWNGQFFSKKKHFHLIALHHNFQNFCPLWNGHLYNHKKTIQILKMIHKDKKLSVTTFCKKRFSGRKTAKRLSGKTICKNCKERSTMRNKKKNYQEHNCGLWVVYVFLCLCLRLTPHPMWPRVTYPICQINIRLTDAFGNSIPLLLKKSENLESRPSKRVSIFSVIRLKERNLPRQIPILIV